jgi:multidrug efflux pump subunit AcrA (membrane-fusion protein)
MMTKRDWRNAGITTALLLGGVSFLLVSHDRTSAGEAAASAPDVEVASVEQRDIPVSREWIGTLDGLVNAAIRSQVTGYLRTRNYSAGSFVKKGQLLFEIDPRSLQAAVDQAQGQLAQANGQLAQAQAHYLQSEAQLASAEANQRKAQFDENAFPEVSNALIAHQTVQEAREKQQALVVVLENRKRLAYARYQGGVDTQLNALDVDRDLLQAKLDLQQIKLNELLSVVQLYKALAAAGGADPCSESGTSPGSRLSPRNYPTAILPVAASTRLCTPSCERLRANRAGAVRIYP